MKLKLLLLFLLVQLGWSERSQCSETLPIYYSSSIPPQKRQEEIESEFKKFDLSPKVFAKLKDFVDLVKDLKPNVLIAPSSMAYYYTDYVPGMRFLNLEGKKEFGYQIFSLMTWSSTQLSDGRIAVVEEVQKDRLNDWVTEITGSKFKLVRSVLKPDDIVPFLLLKSVDLILISKENYEGLKEKWFTQLKPLGETKPVQGLLVYFKKDVDPKSYKEHLSKLTSGTLKALSSSSIVQYEGEAHP